MAVGHNLLGGDREIETRMMWVVEAVGNSGDVT